MCDISHGNRIIINCRTRIAERDQCRNEAILRAEPIVDLMEQIVHSLNAALVNNNFGACQIILHASLMLCKKQIVF